MGIRMKVDKDISREEIENSDRLFKSATPKYTADWYLKWISSAFVLSAMSMRGIEGLQIYDLSFSSRYNRMAYCISIMERQGFNYTK